MFTRAHVIRWLSLAGSAIEENKDFLTQLDAAIGDAEHGISMARGFKKVVSQLPTMADKDIGSILKGTGMLLISSVGGASGALYGTLFVKAGNEASGKLMLDVSEMATVLKAGLAGIIERGRAQPGEKTMVDALSPYVEAFCRAGKGGASMAEALEQATVAAEQGVKDTIPMVAQKGRASYLAERSVGHQDPGATSMCLILKALAQAVS
ncbi:MAG: dihydroxyacetone kinase subunit DhaL [Dehalococcoidales bacterium]|nr:dihydroxyacetone kinase subunit DhaL [Dehalococcoidales bacterium]